MNISLQMHMLGLLSVCAILFWHCTFICCDNHNDAKQNENQGKRFGEGWPQLKADETDNFMPVDEFINKYVIPKRPLIIRGGAKISPAFEKWTDEYFLSLNVPEGNVVRVETIKKETRPQIKEMQHFQEFIKVYNTSDVYMVDSVPDFLRKDLNVPCALRCQEITFDDSVMWISSGGTKSVVHTDAVDNLNCLYRGRKHFILIPSAQRNIFGLDNPDGSYSSVDVDSVDYTKFPGLASVDYYNVSLNAGDCFYIPYMWVHQVRSYGSNIAVNIWWNHMSIPLVDVEKCTQLDCSTLYTLDNLKFHTSEKSDYRALMSVDIIRDHFLNIIGANEFVFMEKFKKSVITLKEWDVHDESLINHADLLFGEIFVRLDMDENNKLTKEEIQKCSEEGWSWIMNSLKELEKFLVGKITNDTNDGGIDIVANGECKGESCDGKKEHGYTEIEGQEDVYGIKNGEEL